MSDALTMTVGTLGQAVVAESETLALVATMIEGSIGADWLERSEIIYALKAAEQAGGNSAEESLIRAWNQRLEHVGSVYRVRIVHLPLAENAARALEITDTRQDLVVDRQNFVF
jgi:hypothetical protein